MKDKPLLIRHATLVTPYGLLRRDLWIEKGKISRHLQKPLEQITVLRNETAEFDATEFYILPGFLGFLPKQATTYRSTVEFLDAIKQMVCHGVTTQIDTIWPSTWLKNSEVMYLTTPHFNSPIDYTLRLSLDAAHFTPDKVMQIRDLGFKHVRIIIRQPEELGGIKWEALSHILVCSRMFLHLHIPNQSMAPNIRNYIQRIWVGECIHYGIRTSVEQADQTQRANVEPFYVIHSLTEKHLPYMLRQMEQNPYEYEPVFCPPDQFQLRARPKEWHPDFLLSTVVRLCSTNIAKAMGCYPRKGSLLPGADADLLFVKKDDWLTNFSLSTILNISEPCLPNYVMSKGKWIIFDRGYIPSIGRGQYIQKLTPYSFAM